MITHNLVEVNPEDILEGRKVTMVHEDEGNREESFPVYRYGSKRLALVPSHMLEVFLATFPLGE